MTDRIDDLLFPAASLAGQRLVRFGKRVTVQRRTRMVRRALEVGPQGWLVRGRQAWWPPAPARASSAPPLAIETLRQGLEQRGFVALTGVPSLLDCYRLQAREEATALAGSARATQALGAWIYGTRVPLREGAIDWSADPTTGLCCWPAEPMDEDGAVAYAATAASAVDVKWVWELGRHQFLAPLAVTGLLEGDAGLTALAVACLASWLRACPPGRGVQWASPLEIALRAISWLWTMPVLLDAPSLLPAISQAWADSLAAHYTTLRARLSVHSDPTNHLIGEAVALWMLATVFPELPGAAEQVRRTSALLEREVARQVGVDGVSEEQASGYHTFVLEFLLQMIALARRNDVVLPPVITDRAAAMVDVLDTLLGCGGDLPQLGDWDDGRAMPCFGPETWRTRAEGLIAVGAPLLGVAVRPGRPARPALVRLFLGTTPPPCALRAPGSRLFARGGLAVSEAASADGATVQTVMRVGGFGALTNAGHAHADVLSVLLRVDDQLLLGDPGSGTYTGDRRVRDTFRSTLLHNTVTLDDLSQADPLDTFKWVNLPSVRQHVWASTAVVDWIGASHDGYRRLRQPVWHRRDVIVVRSEYLLVVDRLFGSGPHRVVRRFVAPPAARVQMEGPGWGMVVGSGGVGLAVVPLPLEPTQRETVRTIDLPWSSGYGRWETTGAIEAYCEVTVPAVFVTALLPAAPGLPALTLGDLTPPVRSATGGLMWQLPLQIGATSRLDGLAVLPAARGAKPESAGALSWMRGAASGAPAVSLCDGRDA